MPRPKKPASNVATAPEPLRKLTKAEKAEADAFFARHGATPPPVKSAVEYTSDKSVRFHHKPGEDPELYAVRLCRAFGTTDADFAQGMLGQLLNLIAERGRRVTSDKLNAALAALDRIGPRDELEAMLAVQMVGTHFGAVDTLRQAVQTDSAPHFVNASTFATKLLRTFTAQMDALNRYRGKGEQKVIVKHVHVHEGGQAIVGHVETGGRGAPSKVEEQPYGPREIGADAPSAALPSPDKARNAVPIPSDPGKDAVPHSRRRAR